MITTIGKITFRSFAFHEISEFGQPRLLYGTIFICNRLKFLCAYFDKTEGNTLPKDTVQIVEAIRIQTNISSEKDYLAWTKRLTPKKDDIIISKAGRVGAVAIIPEGIKCCIGRNQVVLRPNRRKILPKYLLYYMLSPQFRKEIQRLTLSGTVLESLHVKYIPQLRIKLYPLRIQRKIIDALYPLYHKMDLNIQMNKTLEAIAQAIFKNWFVDFAPFKDELVYNEELGKKIPCSWEVVELSNLGRIITGKTPPTSDKENYGNKYLFIRIPDMHNRTFVIDTEVKLSEKGANLMKNLLLPPLSVCVSCIATTGLVALTPEHSFTNQQINSIICNENISPYYIYLYMKRVIAPRIADFGSGGSVTPILNKTEFSNLRVILPPQRILNQFHEKIEAILSGKIRVKVDVEEEFPEEARKLEEIEEEKSRIQKSILEWVKHA